MVLAEKPGTNHILHLILTLVTFGVWIIVWVLAAMASSSNSYRCPHCGAPTKAYAPRGWKPKAIA